MDDPSSVLSVTELGAYAGRLAVIAVCLVLLAFCSLCEAALMRIGLGRARQLAKEGTEGGSPRWGTRRLAELVEKRQEVLGSLILLLNLSIIVASAYATEVTIRLSDGSHRWVPMTSLGMIAFILVFCEVTPKTYALRRAEAVALAVAPVLSAVHRLLHPVARGLHAIAIGLNRGVLVPVIGGQAVARWPGYSDDEMMELVAEGEAEGDIEEEEKEMIAGVIEFADKVTREVMTPRTDMVCVPADASLVATADVSEQGGYSRLPVYEGSVDHIIGIVYVKDMLSALQTARPPQGGRDAGHGADNAGITAGQIARKPAPVVPESKKVDEVLHLMQRRRLHMAIVIDEYGGTAGLVTIEDVLEEIFGEIQDEHDYEAEPIRAMDEATLVVNARVGVDEIEAELGVALPEGDFDSIGGFLLDQLGRLPVAGERVVWQGPGEGEEGSSGVRLEFTVEHVSENRIQRVRIVRSREGEPG